jgi:transcriptional regulator with XRE-family HTH domain
MSNVDPIVSVLRRYRETRGISQEQMATRTGMSISTIQRIESGRSDMKISQYRKYLNALNISEMDVSVSLMSHDFVSDKDLAATARKLPYQVRRVVFSFLDELSAVVKK